jgi:CubicO group peptidase (beta-lactamase class C family)
MRALELVGSWPAAHVSAAVLRGGHVVATNGVQDREYRLASIAKVVTAYAALIACEEGTLHLDQPVGQAG